MFAFGAPRNRTRDARRDRSRSSRDSSAPSSTSPFVLEGRKHQIQSTRAERRLSPIRYPERLASGTSAIIRSGCFDGLNRSR